MEKYLECIVELGMEYGLDMNWKKVELMIVRSKDHVQTPDGRALDPKQSFI